MPGARRSSEIRLAHLGIVKQFFSAALAHDPAAFEDVGAFRDLERPHHVLLDEQHRHPVPADLLDGVEHRVHHPGRQPE